MKLIIDIDESLLDGIKSDNFDFARQVVKNFQGTIASAIANGTPLGVYCDTCEIGNPCLYCKHEFEPQESEEVCQEKKQ